MSAKKAVDLIYDIFEKIEEMSLNIKKIDDEISNLNNKIYNLNSKIKIIDDKIENISLTPARIPNPGSIEAIAPTPSETSQVGDENPGKLVLGNVRLYGYVYNSSRRPISGVSVRVFTGSNDVIREMTTDNSGYWEARVRPGKYSVEYKHGRFKPFNKFVDIPSGKKEFEVK